ncbi:MAG: ATP synthase F0 subunit B [Chloroflexota bacterium]|nr:MAG: ATP synthase F0 subunit B [Chloroflexota bacterium]
MDQLGINVQGLIAQLVNFGILLFLLSKFLFPRVIGALDSRAERIRESLDKAEQVKSDAERMEREFQERLTEARREGQQIVANANQIAQRIHTEAQEKAGREAEAFLTRAREQIQRESELARTQLRQEVAGLAILAASRVVERALDEKQHVDLIERVLNEAGAARN